jgi:hypothetical protein
MRARLLVAMIRSAPVLLACALLVLAPGAAADVVILNGALVVHTTGDPGVGTNVGSGSDLRVNCTGTFCTTYGNVNGAPASATAGCLAGSTAAVCIAESGGPGPALLVLALAGSGPWGNCGGGSVEGTGPVVLVAALGGTPLDGGAAATCSAPGVSCAAVEPILQGEGQISGACVSYDPHTDPSDPGACVGEGTNAPPSTLACEGVHIDPNAPCVTTDDGFVIVCNE